MQGPELTGKGRGTDHSVSVILPYFNRADTLRTAALSVLKQSHPDLTLYLIDDGSTDRSQDIARSLRDERVVHLATEMNSGVCAARNLGLAQARTQLVAFMDSDDAWLPEKLARQISFLRDLQAIGQRVSVVGCAWRYQDGRLDREFGAGPYRRRDVLAGKVAGTGTPMLLVDRAVAAPDPVFDASFPALAERDFLASCLSNGSLVAVSPEVLAVVTRMRHDHVANPQRAAASYERYLVKYRPEFSNDDRLRSWYHFRACREHLIARNRSEAWNHVAGALRDQPTKRSLHLALGLVAGIKGLAVAQRVLPL